MDLREPEHEVLQLESATESLDNLLSRTLFDVIGPLEQAEVRFHSATHQQFFNVLLVDFLSRARSHFSKTTCGTPDDLLSISLTSVLAPESRKFLEAPCRALNAWLATAITVSAWLPSLEKTVALNVARGEYLYLCGNMGKHSFVRLENVSKKLRAILKANNVHLDSDSTVLILDDFYDLFHRDVLNLQATELIELLNEVRWGVQACLQPVYAKSRVTSGGEPESYRYVYPAGVEAKLPQAWFWSLMNRVRQRPNIPKFHGVFSAKRN